MREARPLGVIRHNPEPNRREPAHSTIRLKRQQIAASPISILDQENIRPVKGRIQQRVLGCTKRQPQLRYNYDEKPKFFGIDHGRYEEIRGKYMHFQERQPSKEKFGIARSSFNFEAEQAKFNRLFTEENNEHPSKITLREMPYESALLTRKPNYIQSRPYTPIEQQLDTEQDDDQPLQYRNEELRQYMFRLSHQHSSTSGRLATPKSVNIESQTTLDRISRIDGDIDQKMKHLFKRIEQKEQKKRQKKLVATNVVQKEAQGKTQCVRRISPNVIDIGPILKAIESQMVLDIEFRRLRELISKSEFEAVSKLVAEKCAVLTAETLKVCRSQLNPLDQPKAAEQLSNEQLSKRLVEAYERSETNYRDRLLHKFSPDVIKEWLDEVNIEGAQTVSLADILTQLNLHVGGEFRNRDLVRLASRISGFSTCKQLSCQCLQTTLSWQPNHKP